MQRPETSQIIWLKLFRVGICKYRSNSNDGRSEAYCEAYL